APVAPMPGSETTAAPEPTVVPAPAPVISDVTPPVQPVPQPANFAAPVPPAPAPAPAPSTLPEPTAPFSSPAPASLGDRIIQPLTNPGPATAAPLDIASQMDQALGNTPVAPVQPLPDQSVPPAP